MNRKLFFAFFCFIVLTNLRAEEYYITNEGNDSNKGTSSEKPFKSLEKINSLTLKPGDKVLFRSGNTFRGELKVDFSGNENNPIVFSSYGEGPQPVITGGVVIAGWTGTGNGIYRAKSDQVVHGLFENSREATVARWPNTGFFKVDSGNKVLLVDNKLCSINYDLAGATVRIKSVDWQSEVLTIDRHKRDTIFFREKMLYSAKKDYGYLLDNKLEFLDSPGEWYYHEETGSLYYYPYNPANLKNEVNAVVFSRGLSVKPGVSNIVINNLTIEQYDEACIHAGEGSRSIVVSNCTMRRSGIYGIDAAVGTNFLKMTNNLFSDIHGRGVSLLETSNTLVERNEMKNIGLKPGYGYNGVNNAVGIAVLREELVYVLSKATLQTLKGSGIKPEKIRLIEGYVDLPYTNVNYFRETLEKNLSSRDSGLINFIIEEVEKETAKKVYPSKNNVVRENRLDSIGYIGIRLDGTYSLVERNVVKNTILHMNDGGAIYCWAQHDNYTHNITFRNNIVINAVGNNEATPNNRIFGIGIYVDNRCHDILIEENTVTGATCGILLNDESYNHNVINNTTFDNKYGLMFSEYFRPGTLKGVTASHNILFSKERYQRCLFVESRISEYFSPGVYDNNYYGSPYYTYPILELTFKEGVRRYHEYTLDAWQREKKQDISSSEFAPGDPEARGNESFILINETALSKTFEIDSDRQCYDIKGNVLSKEEKLEPFSSKIVIRK